ncbi:MAG TPA: extracellular solute-binding protein [Xanthobacteraceae bacterium]|uniref:ABC transporter substrate-binding protein n=1 Tax=Roseixanthobacter finlandensis TaxID=3119922 RepID=UPI002B5D5DE9|nr:extracellular solute-binding protein [Xanthobacteraceae bacterium]
MKLTAGFRRNGLTRRQLLVTGAGGVLWSAMPHLVSRAHAEASQPPSVEAAKAEGPVVVWHADQEADVVEFLRIFKEKTGVDAVQQRLLPGAALPKLEAEFRAGQTTGDVYITSDSGIMENLRLQNRLLRYIPKDIDAYAPEYRSAEPGYWTTYYVNVGPMMYDPRYVKKEIAPKTWTDLLDPQWKGQIGFQNSAAGTSYGFWFAMKDVLPKDFWDNLGKNNPRAYASSTQISQDIERGDLKIGGRVSIFQYVKSVRKKQSVEAVFPEIGVPAVNQVIGIFGTTKRPNASKIFTEFMLSKEGQYLWNNIQGSYSARKDIHIEHLPDINTLRLRLPVDFQDYMRPERRREFVAIWNKMTGL